MLKVDEGFILRVIYYRCVKYCTINETQKGVSCTHSSLQGIVCVCGGVGVCVERERKRQRDTEEKETDTHSKGVGRK